MSLSYAAALLSNVDNTQQTTQPAAQKASPKQTTQQPKQKSETTSITQSVSEEVKPAVVEKPVGNDGGLLGLLIRAEKDHVYVPKSGSTSKGPNTRIFDRIRRYTGPAASAALGQTCHFFFSKILHNRAQFSKGLKPTSEIKVDFYVDFASKGDQVKSVPLKSFEFNKRALGKYWFRVVSDVCQKKAPADSSKDVLSDLLSEKKSVKVQLHGGFSFKAERGGPFYIQRDLTSTLPWLNACIRLIGDGKKQEVVSPDGSKVVLSRYGLGGGRVKVETVFPHVKKDETEPWLIPSVHYFEFPQFCIAIHATAKEFLPLVGTCVQELPKGTAKEGVESGYVDREKILKDLLKHKELGTALNNFEHKLHEIPGPEVTNYMREQTVKKVRVLKQQAKENENIRNFFLEQVAGEVEEAKRQAKQINELTETLRVERNNLKQQQRLAQFNNKAGEASEDKDKAGEQGEPKEAKTKKPSTVVKKVEEKDGFVVKKTFLKTGEKLEEKEVPVTAAPVAVAKSQKKQKAEAVNALFDSNPFHATRFETAFQSVADEQYNATQKKVLLREAAEKKQAAATRKAQAQAEQQEAVSAKALTKAQKTAAAQALARQQQQAAQQPAKVQPAAQPQKGQQQPQKAAQPAAQKGQQQPQKGQQQPQKGQQQPQKGQQQPQKGQQQKTPAPATPAAKQQTQQPQKKTPQPQTQKPQPSPATPSPKQQQPKPKQQQKQAQGGKKNNNKNNQNNPTASQTDENALLAPSTVVAAVVGLVAFCYVFVF